MYIREEVITLLAVQFISLFSQVSLEVFTIYVHNQNIRHSAFLEVPQKSTPMMLKLDVCR